MELAWCVKVVDQDNAPDRVGDLKPLLAPRVVAVIGASRERRKVGSEILHNILASGFIGQVVAIHPSAVDLHGVRAYPSIGAVPVDVDLAVIVVPAADVEGEVDACLTKGVRALCIISAGFGECSVEGRAMERALAARARRAGCRMVGPNCMGLLNTGPSIQLNATFSPVYPPSGNIAMSTQSGALGVAILDYARSINLGISSFVSIGNKADVSSNDLLQYWEDDPLTSVVLLYLESFGNPAKFSRIARRISRVKPIVALKAGRSSAGARAAASHTGALASSDRFVDALFHQCGVIRTDTITELFDVASILSRQPLPSGGRVAILTNAGGPGILAADACQSHGLVVSDLAGETRDALRRSLPESASVSNPVDMLASASAGQYEHALRTVLGDPNVDSVIVIFIPPLMTNADDVARAVSRAVHAAPGKAVVGVFMSQDHAAGSLTSIPRFAFPEPAALALARVTQYAGWRRSPPGVVPALPDLQPSLARLVVDGVLERGGGWLNAVEATSLLSSIGITVPRATMAQTADEAADIADQVGLPVAVKAVGAGLLHKTEHKAVRLNLHTCADVRRAAASLLATLGDKAEGLLVQSMVTGGAEMMIGAINDPTFGHVIACGTGGVLIDLLADSACRLYPVTDQDARDMVESLKGVRLLRGFRGSAPDDEEAFRDAILRVSALVGICPEIQELDINPLSVLPGGVSALDVRVRVAANAH